MKTFELSIFFLALAALLSACVGEPFEAALPLPLALSSLPSTTVSASIASVGTSSSVSSSGAGGKGGGGGGPVTTPATASSSEGVGGSGGAGGFHPASTAVSSTAASSVAASSTIASSAQTSSSSGGDPICEEGYPGFSCSLGKNLWTCPIGLAPPPPSSSCVDSGSGLPEGNHFWCCY